MGITIIHFERSDHHRINVYVFYIIQVHSAAWNDPDNRTREPQCITYYQN